MMHRCRCGHADELHSAIFGTCLAWPAPEAARDPEGLCGCEQFDAPPEQPGLVRRVLAGLPGVRL